MAELVIEGLEGLQTLFDEVVADFNDTNWLAFGDQELGHLQDIHDARFGVNVDPTLSPWIPTTPQSIKRRKRNRDGAGQTLVDTGLLRDQLTKDGQGIREVVSEPGQGGVSFGYDPQDVPYAHYHETGTSRMPARRHVGADEGYVDGAAVRAVNYAVNQLTERGRA